MLKTVQAIIFKLADIKDWKIAFMYMLTICFLAYCVFFGGVKHANSLKEYFFGNDKEMNVRQVQEIDQEVKDVLKNTEKRK